MVDITLYGNLTFDTVFKDFDQYKSIGSIGNVWDSIINIDPNKLIHIEPIEIGSALVYINTVSGDKVSKPNLQLKYNKPKIIDSTWSHITYINRLRDLSFISEIKNSIISADIAGKKTFDTSYLKYIDYLFVSDDEIINLDELISLVKIAVIVHNNSGSITYYKNDTIINNHKVLKNINILGAGDYFASAFIVSMIETNNLKKSLENSHALVFEYLKNNI
jgi:hypothetical protein